jgi:hypothetical protein
MNALQLALVDVDRAFTQLEFAVKLLCYAELDHIDRVKFDTDLTIRLEKENVGFPANTFQSLETVVLAAQIGVGVSFGVSAIVLDAAFEAAAVSQKPMAIGQEDLLRTLVYMVRCAFAHNPAMPIWEARGPYARDLTLCLAGESISIDLRLLHGKAFEYAHIGGLANWYRIRRATVSLLQGMSSRVEAKE